MIFALSLSSVYNLDRSVNTRANAGARRCIANGGVFLLAFCFACQHGDPQRPVCDPAAKMPREWVSPGDVFLFGEVHGIEELPDFFAEVSCNASSGGANVSVGLEIPRSEQSNIDEYLASGGTSVDRNKLLASPFWTRAYQDGRSSVAMAQLLERLRQLRRSGANVVVFAFDVEPSEVSPQRDEQMARAIAARVASHPDHLFLVLTGNLHARTRKGAPWDATWTPMGWYLADAGIRVTAFDVRGPSGSAWICTGSTATSCGERNTKATSELPSKRQRGVELLASPSPQGFHGLYRIESRTASPPAKLQNREPVMPPE